MLRSYPVLLIPAALTLVGFGLSSTPASAQTTLPFEANYEVLNRFRIITDPNIQPFFARANPRWTSTDAPYGLTQLTGTVLAELNFNTNIFSFTEDPAVGPLVLGGEGPNRLYITDIATGVLDPETLIATTNGVLGIVGGEGLFEGATGSLNFTEIGRISTSEDEPFMAQSRITGSIQIPRTVPEPRTDTTLLSIGEIGAGLLLRRRSRSLAEKDKGSSQISPLAKV